MVQSLLVLILPRLWLRRKRWWGRKPWRVLLTQHYWRITIARAGGF